MSGVTIITGASRGIGRACALRVGAMGHMVVVNYINDAGAAENVVRDITAAGGKAVAVKGDVASEADILAIFAAADRLGPLVGLINNAGIVAPVGKVETYSAERVTRMMAVNVTGTILCAREAIKRMSTKHGGTGGTIVNIGSIAARLGSPNEFVDYAASKGAVDAFTIGLSREVAGEGIRVNCVRPGMIATDIHASAGVPDRAARLGSTVPIGREGYPEEIAGIVAWLFTDAASYAAGAIIDITGGR